MGQYRFEIHFSGIFRLNTLVGIRLMYIIKNVCFLYISHIGSTIKLNEQKYKS